MRPRGQRPSLGLPSRPWTARDVKWPDWGEPPPMDEDTAGGTRAVFCSRDLVAGAGRITRSAEAGCQLSVRAQYPQIVLRGYYWITGIASSFRRWLHADLESQ